MGYLRRSIGSRNTGSIEIYMIMKSKQVLSIEQMRHLQNLGLDTSDASMVLIAIDDDSCPLDWETALEGMSTHLYDVSFDLFDADSPYYDHSYRKDCGVFTLQDIIGLLPKEIKIGADTYWLTISIYDCNVWYICYSMSDEFDYFQEFKSELLIDCAYNMLCWCVENSYIKKGE